MTFSNGWPPNSDAWDVISTYAGDSEQLVEGLLLRATEQARFDAVLAERTRLAGELHDTLLQAFTGVTPNYRLCAVAC